MKYGITTLQYYIAPFSAPVPTAIAVGASLTHALSQIPGIDPLLALLGGIGGGLATEVSGGLMFSMAARAFFQRKWGALMVALLGSGFYIGVIAWSVSTSGDPVPIIGAAIVAGLVYVAIALYQYFDAIEKDAIIARKDAEQTRQQADADRKTELDTRIMMMDKEIELEQRRAEIEQLRLNAESERIRQEKLLEHARARAARSSEHPGFVRSVRRTTNEQNLRPDWLQKTRDFLGDNPEATTREVAENLGAKSSSTGKAYRDAVLAEMPKAIEP